MTTWESEPEELLEWPLVQISEGHQLAEAPRILSDGAILHSDVLAGGVTRIERDHETRSEVIPKRRGIGGLLPHADGGLIVTGRDLSYFAPHGEQSTIFAPPGSKGLNDLCSDGAGGVYVGSLKFEAISGGDPVPGEIWHVPAKAEPKLIADHIYWPNGIGVSPDGSTLYVSDTHKQEVSKIDLATGDHKPLIHIEHGLPDGLAVDENGNIWLALGHRGAVGIFQESGTGIGRIELPTEFVTSVAFGGPDHEDIVVTTATKVLHGRVKTPGLVQTPARL